MKAYLNIVAICAAALSAAASPASAATASCNDQHAVCQQRGGTEERCLMVWHQCKVAQARPTALRPAPAAKPVNVAARR